MNNEAYLLQIFRMNSGRVPAVQRLAYAKEMLKIYKKYAWVKLEPRPLLTRNYL